MLTGASCRDWEFRSSKNLMELCPTAMENRNQGGYWLTWWRATEYVRVNAVTRQICQFFKSICDIPIWSEGNSASTVLLLFICSWLMAVFFTVFKGQLQQKKFYSRISLDFVFVFQTYVSNFLLKQLLFKETTLMIIIFCAKNSTRPEVYKFTMEMAFTFWEEGCDWLIWYLHPVRCDVGATSYQSWIAAVSS